MMTSRTLLTEGTFELLVLKPQLLQMLKMYVEFLTNNKLRADFSFYMYICELYGALYCHIVSRCERWRLELCKKKKMYLINFIV